MSMLCHAICHVVLHAESTRATTLQFLIEKKFLALDQEFFLFNHASLVLLKAVIMRLGLYR